MGIKGLKPLLRSYGVHEYAVPLSQMAGKTIAVDGTFLLHKYKNCHSVPWHYLTLYTLSNLRLRNVKVLFIFDGMSPPEKSREKSNRRCRKQALMEKGALIKAQLEVWKKNGGEQAPELAAVFERLVKTRGLDPSLTDPETVQVMTDYVDNMSRDTRVTSDDYELMRRSLDAFGFPYADAPDEAELCCVRLVQMGIADAPMTIDSDALACGALHGVDVVYTDLHGETLTAMSTLKSKEALGLNGEQFMDLCVMCGTDFNQRVHKLGPVTALKLIKAHGSIENIPSAAAPSTSCLEAVRTREILSGGDMESRRKDYEAMVQKPVSAELIRSVFPPEFLDKLLHENWQLRDAMKRMAPEAFEKCKRK
ncbi:putative DNA repair protein RAD2 [Ranavirus ambystoma1]|uniref:Putative DNA repair protein RAD2 n=1 Tax=Ranavirus ambystoma1 TaxID=265294 RepID=A0A0U2RH66_9VIRU|nr:putative DNA repair protein RAD2 [Ambystoma tigrinum virus]